MAVEDVHKPVAGGVPEHVTNADADSFPDVRWASRIHEAVVESIARRRSKEQGNVSREDAQRAVDRGRQALRHDPRC